MESQIEEAKRELAGIDPYDLGPTKAERFKTYKDNREKLVASKERTWLRRHGKSEYIDFTEEERNVLRRYFMSLDDDGSGSIGVDELVEPLIALGLAESVD
jgi:centrin-2